MGTNFGEQFWFEIVYCLGSNLEESIVEKIPEDDPKKNFDLPEDMRFGQAQVNFSFSSSHVTGDFTLQYIYINI